MRKRGVWASAQDAVYRVREKPAGFSIGTLHAQLSDKSTCSTLL